MRIIHTTTDASLADTQTMVFAHAFPGAEVVAALSYGDVTKACLDDAIDLFIITANLPYEWKLRFEEALRVSCPKAKLVEIFYFAPETHADVKFLSADGPAELVRVLQDVMAASSTGKRLPQ